MNRRHCDWTKHPLPNHQPEPAVAYYHSCGHYDVEAR